MYDTLNNLPVPFFHCGVTVLRLGLPTLSLKSSLEPLKRESHEEIGKLVVNRVV